MRHRKPCPCAGEVVRTVSSPWASRYTTYGRGGTDTLESAPGRPVVARRRRRFVGTSWQYPLERFSCSASTGHALRGLSCGRDGGTPASKAIRLVKTGSLPEQQSSEFSRPGGAAKQRWRQRSGGSTQPTGYCEVECEQNRFTKGSKARRGKSGGPRRPDESPVVFGFGHKFGDITQGSQVRSYDDYRVWVGRTILYYLWIVKVGPYLRKAPAPPFTQAILLPFVNS